MGKHNVTTREALYNAVWSQPLTKLAPEYGLSDVGLAKVCERYQIPRPPFGYWAKVAAGQTPLQCPLPELDSTDLEEIQLYRREFETKPVVHSAPVDIEVPSRLSRPHRHVQRTRTALEAGDKDERGIVLPAGMRNLAVSVTRKSVPRALRIVDTIIKYWEMTEGQVSVDKGCTYFSRGPDRVSVVLREHVERSEKKGQKGVGIWSSTFTRYSYRGTGRLILEVDHWGDGLRRKWADGKVQRLEKVLGTFVAGLEQWIVHTRHQRLDAECRQRQERRAMEMRELIEARRKEADRRIEAIERSVEGWVKAKQVRDYLADLDKRIEDGRMEISDEEAYGQWRSWAEWFADNVCPWTAANEPPHAGEQVGPTNALITELDLTSSARDQVINLGFTDSDELSVLSRSELSQACGTDAWSLHREITLVLEGLGYDVSDRAPY